MIWYLPGGTLMLAPVRSVSAAVEEESPLVCVALYTV